MALMSGRDGRARSLGVKALPILLVGCTATYRYTPTRTTSATSDCVNDCRTASGGPVDLACTRACGVEWKEDRGTCAELREIGEWHDEAPSPLCFESTRTTPEGKVGLATLGVLGIVAALALMVVAAAAVMGPPTGG